MKIITTAGVIAWVAASVAAGFAAGPKSGAAAAKDRMLGAGKYQAQVNGIVCGGCGEFIQRTLQKVQGIESASVDQAKKSVQFQVKRNAKVRLAEVQKALQASAERMGMGADYLLRNLKKAS